jgi:coatomer protein complex subunit epsilon
VQPLFDPHFYMCFHFQDQALANLAEWLADPAIASNPTLLLVTGVIYAHEQNYNEALKHTHVGGTLDL